ncbi:hypothetical protein VTK26DRAFT_584 [Humicola hyalothermophila]
MASSPYDPYVPRNSPTASSPGAGGPTGTEHIQEQLRATIGVMTENVKLAEARGENIDNLRDKTDDLQGAAQQFRRGANQVRKKMWWKDMKMRIWLIIGIVVLLAIIIIPSVLATKK